MKYILQEKRRAIGWINVKIFNAEELDSAIQSCLDKNHKNFKSTKNYYKTRIIEDKSKKVVFPSLENKIWVNS